MEDCSGPTDWFECSDRAFMSDRTFPWRYHSRQSKRESWKLSRFQCSLLLALRELARESRPPNSPHLEKVRTLGQLKSCCTFSGVCSRSPVRIGLRKWSWDVNNRFSSIVRNKSGMTWNKMKRLKKNNYEYFNNQIVGTVIKRWHFVEINVSKNELIAVMKETLDANSLSYLLVSCLLRLYRV